MRPRVMRAGLLAAALAVPVLAGAGTASAASAAPAAHPHKYSKRVCSVAPAGSAACQSKVVTDAGGKPLATSTPAGYGPTDIENAYKLSTSQGAGATVAIVDAYNDPNAEKDLAVYRSQYGLAACTTANGCFRKVNQTGGTSLPTSNGGWAQEISLDLDMVSSACPACKILLVEAKTSSFANLGTGVNTAASLGAAAISNSYGGSDASDSTYGHYYYHPGHAVTVSSGDNGYGVEYPASSQWVTAVGGTSLSKASNGRGWSESAWSGAGSGCSAYNVKPTWESSATSCSKRAVADVSAVADPNTGVAVYDSYSYQGASGWLVFGGTSAASPIIASVYAAASTVTGHTAVASPAATPWANSGSLFDVTSGSNGTCPTTVWCNSGTGWDGPTGLGTPNGYGAF